MKLTDEILPGVSLGGIPIDGDAATLLRRLSRHYRIDSRGDHHVLENGLVIIGEDADGKIPYAMCNASFPSRYRDRLWAGMTVTDVLQNTRHQLAWIGVVVVDGIDGIGLPLPNHADDFERLTDHLPDDHVFAYLSVFRARTPSQRKKGRGKGPRG